MRYAINLTFIGEKDRNARKRISVKIFWAGQIANFYIC